MKIYKKQTREIDFLGETICDKCMKPIERESSFDSFSATFEVTTGECYPEGCFTESQTADLCEDCANLAIDLLKNFGVRFNKTESL